jgi:hypothetical protein
MTVFAGIVTAAVAALNSGAPVSANVCRARVRALPESWQTAVSVRMQGADFERFTMRGAPVNVDTQLVVECYARSTTLQPDQAADALLGSVYARLALDPTLGGLVADLEAQSLEYDFESLADQAACISITYLVRHRAQSLSLE